MSPVPLTYGAVIALLAITLAGCLPRAESPRSGSAAQPGAATTAPPPAPAQAPTSPSPPAGAAQSVRIEIDPEASEARYRAQEVLARIRLPTEAVGRARAVRGVIVLGPTGTVIAEDSKVTVDLRQLRSDEGLRDRTAQTDMLQTARFPAAEFVAREIVGIPWPPPASGELTFELIGDLTVHGVSRAVTWQGTATLSGKLVRLRCRLG